MRHPMEDKITIIEGPPPTFEETSEYWAESLTDSFYVSRIVYTKLRTFNGRELVERCKRAWQERDTIFLEYKTFEGLESRAPIIAARHIETGDGDVLLLWLRIVDRAVELEIGYEDELDLDDDDDEDSDRDEDDIDFGDFGFMNPLN